MLADGDDDGGGDGSSFYVPSFFPALGSYFSLENVLYIEGGARFPFFQFHYSPIFSFLE